jgi:KDO2-lipid IV(A) lauroyltransferase
VSAAPTITLTDRVQYGALRVVVALLGLVPFRVASAAGAALGRFGYSPLGIRRTVVDNQLEMAYPELSVAERSAIARAAYENLGRVGLETTVLSKLPPGRVLALFHEPHGWEHVTTALAAGQGLLLVSGHLGNWELGAGFLAARGVPIEAVARRMNNPLVDGYLTRSRQRLGVTVVFDHDAVKRIPRAVREGHAVALLADQGVKGLAASYVPFFGRLARTPKGPAVFALRFGIPCVLAVVVREPDGRYRMIFEPVPVVDTGDREHDVDAIVAAYTAQLEAIVRRYPGQYLWHHRRWRRQPDLSNVEP